MDSTNWKIRESPIGRPQRLLLADYPRRPASRHHSATLTRVLESSSRLQSAFRDCLQPPSTLGIRLCYALSQEVDVSRCVLACLVLVVLSALILATVLTKNEEIFFSGAVALFTALLFLVNRELSQAQRTLTSLQKDLLGNQEAFNKWTRESTDRLRNPQLTPHGTLRIERSDNNQGLKVTLYLGNPGDVLVSLSGIRFHSDAALSKAEQARCVWRSLHPLLSTSMNDEAHFHQGFPVPVFAGGLCEVRVFLDAKTHTVLEECMNVRVACLELGYSAAGTDTTWHAVKLKTGAHGVVDASSV